jgi:hypothetical protein
MFQSKIIIIIIIIVYYYYCLLITIIQYAYNNNISYDKSYNKTNGVMLY